MMSSSTDNWLRRDRAGTATTETLLILTPLLLFILFYSKARTYWLGNISRESRMHQLLFEQVATDPVPYWSPDNAYRILEGDDVYYIWRKSATRIGRPRSKTPRFRGPPRSYVVVAHGEREGNVNEPPTMGAGTVRGSATWVSFPFLRSQHYKLEGLFLKQWYGKQKAKKELDKARRGLKLGT